MKLLAFLRNHAHYWGVPHPDAKNNRLVQTCYECGAERQITKWLSPEGEQELLRRQCIKRKLVPEDIARVVLFLASDDSGACTNQSYIVDGGWV